MYQLHVVPSSENSKVGPCATTYRPVGDSAKGEGTCPSGCPHLGKACYTRKGKTNLWQARSASKFDSMDKLTSKGAQFIRFLTSGDWFKTDPTAPKGYSTDLEHAEDAIRVCRQNPRVTGWSYCHDIKQFVADTGYSYNARNLPANFHLLASCEDLDVKAWAIAYGFKTARVIKTMADKTKDEVFCPYDKAKHLGKKQAEIKIRCVNCRLCWEGPHNIAFLEQ